MHRSITCLLLDDEVVRSLSSLLMLLQKYLDKSWTVDTTVSARTGLVLVNLDETDANGSLPPIPAGTQVIGVARRPRQHAPGTIHRPLRAYEILAQLKEAERLAATHDANAEGDPQADSATQVLEHDEARIFRMEYWPPQFKQWPHAWWTVMAALRNRPLSIEQIATHTGLERQTIAQCLDALLAVTAVSVKFDMSNLQQAQPPSAEKKSLWKRIGSRVSTLLRSR